MKYFKQITFKTPKKSQTLGQTPNEILQSICFSKKARLGLIWLRKNPNGNPGSESIFIGSGDPDLGGGVRTHNFFDWSNRLAVLTKEALLGAPGVPPGAPKGSGDLKVCSSDPPTPI